MQIEISNLAGQETFFPLVTGVSAELLTLDGGSQCLDVLITTSERWLTFHRQGGDPTVQFDEKAGKFPIHQLIRVGLELPNETGVLLVAQNPEEEKLLRLPVWTSINKDQIQLRFMPNGQFTNTLGSFGQ